VAKRLWIPEVGASVRLKAFWMYTALKPDGGFPPPGPWSHFYVVSVNTVQPDSQLSSVRLRHADPPALKSEAGTAWEGTVALSDVSRPTGWRSTYDIYAGRSPTADVIIAGWFTRGIAVLGVARSVERRAHGVLAVD
jgi:hypothetical protein